jgi:uncharacterized protein YcbX
MEGGAMLRRIINLILCLTVLSAAAFAFAEDVYVTRFGTKFHKQGCSLIANRDSRRIGLKEVRAKGLEPCKRCFGLAAKQSAQKPDRSARAKKQDLVYVTANGKRYHHKGCSLLKNKKVKGITLAEAQAKGLKPCSRCFSQ